MAVFKYLDLSTAYITQSDSEALTEMVQRTDEHVDFQKFNDAQPLRVLWHDYGYMIGVPALDPHESDPVRECGRFSEAFHGVLQRARDLDCRWLNLDVDGCGDDTLPTFDW